MPGRFTPDATIHQFQSSYNGQHAKNKSWLAVSLVLSYSNTNFALNWRYMRKRNISVTSIVHLSLKKFVSYKIFLIISRELRLQAERVSWRISTKWINESGRVLKFACELSCLQMLVPNSFDKLCDRTSTRHDICVYYAIRDHYNKEPLNATTLEVPIWRRCGVMQFESCMLTDSIRFLLCNHFIVCQITSPLQHIWDTSSQKESG